MEFSLDEFVISPSLAKLEKCKKADLLIVASCYNVHVPYSIRKAELKQLLWSKLVEQGVLPRPAGDATDAAAGDAAGDALEADVKAAEVAAMLTPGVEPGPVTDSLMGGGMTTEDLHIALQIKEVENRNKQLEVQAMHLRIRMLELEKGAPVASTPVSPFGRSSVSVPAFDISKHIALVPPFRESEVDSYFSAFERIAATLSWPKEFWSLLLQCKLVGKAQEPFVSHGFVSLTGEESDKVPVTILRDTAAYDSFMLTSVLPLSNKTSCFSDLLVWGIKMSELNAPLHMIHLHSPLVSGHVKVAVLPRFPIDRWHFVYFG
ncbi:hypothetical protein JOB18_022732 [Solea senegalensis]|uniref:Uncharacterized protein n=1 Tax=Solea senegalensis TaxID=28829 RepID=A0AAV6PMF6_SOLSE|nr:hypothetical protein JOB18_022732 [Solea senegalensis]